jgi:hypothetical protein
MKTQKFMRELTSYVVVHKVWMDHVVRFEVDTHERSHRSLITLGILVSNAVSS